VTRHDARRAVGEEDEDVGGRQEGGARDAEAGELRGAEVADDGAVGEEEERLGDQGEEGRDGEAEDLARGGRRLLGLPVARHPARIVAATPGSQRVSPRDAKRW